MYVIMLKETAAELREMSGFEAVKLVSLSTLSWYMLHSEPRKTTGKWCTELKHMLAKTIHTQHINV